MKMKIIMLALLAFSVSSHAALITSSSDASLTGATVETFNSVALGEYSSLSVMGATIIGHGGTMSITEGHGGQYSQDGRVLENTNTSPESFDIIFDNTVDAFGIWGGAYNHSWSFSAYDSLDNLLESVTVSVGCCDSTFFGIAHAGITKVTLASLSSDWVVFDNLTFKASSVSAVPVPAALFLFAPALLGFLGFRRKKAA
ncbi:MAG: hypothetical protein AB1Y22_09740 [Cycloclasticus sp.]